eukprot:2128298-Lingulodinium_polyedra.AAC.1
MPVAIKVNFVSNKDDMELTEGSDMPGKTEVTGSPVHTGSKNNTDNTEATKSPLIPDKAEAAGVP